MTTVHDATKRGAKGFESLHYKDLQDARIPHRPSETTLSPHFDLSKTRLETLAIMLAGLANGRVNLGHLSSQFPGKALLSSSSSACMSEDVVARFTCSI